MIQRDEYQRVVNQQEACMSKLKRVQKENEKLREGRELLEREKDNWESQAKTLCVRNEKLQAQLSLWKGTAP